MKSKLFTPRLSPRKSTAIEAVETAEIFVNPPTHQEVPRFYAPTTDGGACPHNLKLNGTGEAKTPTPERRIFTTRPQEGFDY